MSAGALDDGVGTPSSGAGDAPATVAEELDFRAALLDGGELDATTLAGTDVAFWFWAPWCTNCRAEAPEVAAAAQDFAGDVRVIGIAGRGERSEMQGFVADTGTDGFAHLVDDTGELWARFGVTQQPAFAFVDDSGSVEVIGGQLSSSELAEHLQSLASA